ncbi:hypothetical protein [Acetobacter phage phiAX1]|nr:hypothetical protein [Acetobacter phage phiAX1]
MLAAAAEKPNCEKDWDKAERERKRKHDDRTYSRQGKTIIIASIALAFNFIALGVAIGSAYISRKSSESANESVKTAHSSVEIAKRALDDSNKFKEIDLEPLIQVELPTEVDTDISKPLVAKFKNIGTHEFRIGTWHLFANKVDGYDFSLARKRDDETYENVHYENVLMPGESTTEYHDKPFININPEKYRIIFIAYSIAIKSPTGRIFSREYCKMYHYEFGAYRLVANPCPSYEDMREIK